MTQEFSKPATTLLRAREQFAAEKRFNSERDPGNQISFCCRYRWSSPAPCSSQTLFSAPHD